MTLVEPRPVKQMPTWLSATIILACIAAAGAVGWWFWTGGPNGSVVVLKHNPGDGVQTRSKNRWDIRGGLGVLHVTQPREGQPELNFEFAKYEFLTQDQVNTLSTVRRIVDDRQVARDLRITPEQAATLKQIRQGAKVELNDTDRARLTDLFTQWQKATGTAKDQAQDALLEALDNVARARVAATRQSAAERVALAKQTVTAEQWKRFDDLTK